MCHHVVITPYFLPIVGWLQAREMAKSSETLYRGLVSSTQLSVFKKKKNLFSIKNIY